MDPFLPLGELAPGTADRLVRTGARLLHANRLDPDRTTARDALGAEPGAGGGRRAGEPRLHVYGNPGRPCPRCGTRIRTRVFGKLPRRVFWCPACQPPGAGGIAAGGITRGGPTPP